jgi:hypothetical protein
MGDVIAGLVGRMLSAIFPQAVAWFNRPKLVIDFEGGQSNIVHNQEKNNGKMVSLIYVRARVRNEGRHTAKGCRIFLTNLKEVFAGGKTLSTALDDSKVLSWATAGFSAVDVPSGTQFYVDVVRISKHASGWLFSVEKLLSSQQSLKDYVGTYRFRLMATADNAASAFCDIDVSYNGDWHNLRAWQVEPPS